jgi:leucyl-tRNA synthetase
MPRYDFRRIESRWQQYWEQHQTFKVQDCAADKPKLYVLDMFPYPSGGACTSDIRKATPPRTSFAATPRMRGKNVLHPMG